MTVREDALASQVVVGKMDDHPGLLALQIVIGDCVDDCDTVLLSPAQADEVADELRAFAFTEGRRALVKKLARLAQLAGDADEDGLAGALREAIRLVLGEPAETWNAMTPEVWRARLRLLVLNGK